MTEEENAAEVAAYTKAFFASKTKKPEPKKVYDAKTKKWAWSFIEQPSQISMNLPSDYDRELKKQARAQAEEKEKKRQAIKQGKQIAQLGQQKNQSVPPLIVRSDIDKEFQADMDRDLELLDPRAIAGAALQGITVAQAREKAAVFGMSLGQLLGYEAEPILEVAYKYVKGKPMLEHSAELEHLSTHMRNLHDWYMTHTSKKDAKEYIAVPVREEHYFKSYTIHVQLNELFQLYNMRALDKSIISCYCLMKMLECKRKRIYEVGFIDPYIVNEKTLEDYPKDVEDDLTTFLIKQDYCTDILFPYGFKFHWILLNIQVDNSIVEVQDSLNWDQSTWGNMKAMLQKCWKNFKKVVQGPFKDELQFRTVKSPQQPPGSNLCGYYVCEFIREHTTERRSAGMSEMREMLEPERRVRGIQEELAGFLLKEVLTEKGEHYVSDDELYV